MKNFTKQSAKVILSLIFVLFVQANSFALIFPINLTLSGANENPPNASPATGTLTGTYDNVSKVISITLNWSGFIGNTTAGHFHAPAGVTTNAPVRIGFVGIPTGSTSGTFSNSYVLTAQQEGWLLTDSMYVNVHSTVFPGGEIRKQVSLDAPLPVELTSFSSTVNDNNVSLNWTTASEINNSGFEIERSVLNNQWNNVGFVIGNGTVNNASNYSFSEKVNSGTYNYRLKQIDVNGNYEYFNLSNEVLVGVPSAFSLSQNYPNPFNPSTKIDFALPKDGNVKITLYDMSGKEISTILNENKPAGYYNVQLNASNLSSGIYFYSINSNNFTATKKMMLIK